MYSKFTKEYVKDLFDYKEGKLLWKIRKANCIQIGSEAGYTANKGYKQVEIGGKAYYVHRLIWIWHNGFTGESQIDHINNNTSDNRIENLRSADNTQNAHNQKLAKNNKSGFKGVSWHNQMCKWRADITIKGKKKHLGLFDKLEDAAKAYDIVATEYFKEYAKINLKENV
jgi:hypothetical protein